MKSKNLEILSELEEIFKSPSNTCNIIEGDSKEFGDPDKLVIKAGEDILEFTIKTGNSWYYSGQDSVRIISMYYYKKGTSPYCSTSYKLLDTTGDINFITSWAKSRKEDSKLLEELETVQAGLRNIADRLKLKSLVVKENKFSKLIKIPKVIYTVGEPEEYFNSMVLELQLPNITNPEVKPTLIIQARKNYGENEVSLWSNIRQIDISKKDGHASLISLGKEEKLVKGDIQHLSVFLESWSIKEVTEAIDKNIHISNKIKELYEI